MPELLAHLIGDYVLQNHWMANEKTKRWWPALFHAVLYTLPFLLLTADPVALAIIGGTHAVIDRYRLARWWVEFWGVGNEGRLVAVVMRLRGYQSIAHSEEDGPTEWWWRPKGEVWTGPADRPQVAPAPPFLAVWLLIIVDDTLHMAINHVALGM